MSQGFADAFAEPEAAHKNRVMHATWGHLIPKACIKRKGYILFTRGEYRQDVCIRSAFEGAPDSPWFYVQLHDFIHRKLNQRGTFGRLYRFDGTVMLCKNGKFKFSGKVRAVRV